MTLDDESLMLFEDGLRAHLPGVDEIVARAAVRKRRGKAAVAVAVLSLVAGVFWLDPVYDSEQVATAVGERSRWKMSDGSEVALNTDSSLRVDYHLRSRRLYLPRGEAMFTVAHSRLRSFIVFANQTRVEDIGTVFNVRNRARGAQVTVLEGRVEVSSELDEGRVRVLDAGQSIEVDSDPLGMPYSVDAAVVAGWHDGKLHFDNTPLREVVAELNRYRVKPVRLSPALAALRITGQFDIDKSEQLLGMLPALAPVAIVRETEGISIVPKRP